MLLKILKKHEQHRRNIVIIIADDMRADALNNLLVRTPNFDSLAADGVTFAQNYAVNPVCAPSRMAIFTGLYPQVNGHRSLYQLLKPYEENLFKFLKQNGYHTIMAGKNDLMTAPAIRESFHHRLASQRKIYLEIVRKRLRKLPVGKRVKFLYLASCSLGKDRISYDSLIGDPRFKEFEGLLPSVHSPFPPHHRLYHSFYFGKADPDSVVARMDPLIFEEAVRWLNSAPPQPFCLYLAATLPHTPYQVDDPYLSLVNRAAVADPIPAQLDDKPEFMRELYDRYGMAQVSQEDWREIRAVCAGMVAKLDEQIGKVLDTLKARGWYDDAVIIFLSDHGDYVGDYGLPEKWPTGFQDDLLHTPLIVKFPNNEHAGLRVEGFTQSLDIFPTVLEQAEIQPLYTQFGESLTSIIKNAASRNEVYAVGGYDPREPQAFEAGIKSANDPMLGHYYEKLRLQQGNPTTVARTTMIRTREWKLVIRSAGKEELYDLRNDPSELKNLIDVPALNEVQDELRQRLLYWYLRTSDNPAAEHERSV